MKTKRPTWGLSPVVIKALDYIGSHRATKVKPGLNSCPISKRTANKLVRWHWAMWLSDGSIMLTAEGERYWGQRHPNSKYRIR